MLIFDMEKLLIVFSFNWHRCGSAHSAGNTVYSSVELTGHRGSLLSSVLLPDRKKHWNQPGAGVMIDDKPPMVRASLLTCSCTFQH